MRFIFLLSISLSFVCFSVDEIGEGAVSYTHLDVYKRQAHRDAIALTIFQSCRLLGLAPIDYLNACTPTLLLDRLGRPQDLTSITPAAVAAAPMAFS